MPTTDSADSTPSTVLGGAGNASDRVKTGDIGASAAEYAETTTVIAELVTLSDEGAGATTAVGGTGRAALSLLELA